MDGVFGRRRSAVNETLLLGLEQTVDTTLPEVRWLESWLSPLLFLDAVFMRRSEVIDAVVVGFARTG